MRILYTLIAILILGCNSKPNYPDIHIVGAMKNVMLKGELYGKINLDTISNKKGLYGLGPKSYLTGELLINNGKSYVSKVISDTSMSVIQQFDVSAPFFVFANVTEWKEFDLPTNIKSISDLESFIDSTSFEYKKPFAFKLIGKISSATIHIQNLPEGTKVSSPKEAHHGQINYKLVNEKVEIIGFFSTNHQGIFTHHNSFLHMHLITIDESKMGHLDKLEIEKMKLYLPQN
jgi:acetolactate decarboxylase